MVPPVPGARCHAPQRVAGEGTGAHACVPPHQSGAAGPTGVLRAAALRVGCRTGLTPGTAAGSTLLCPRQKHHPARWHAVVAACGSPALTVSIP